MARRKHSHGEGTKFYDAVDDKWSRIGEMSDAEWLKFAAQLTDEVDKEDEKVADNGKVVEVITPSSHESNKKWPQQSGQQSSYQSSYTTTICYHDPGKIVFHRGKKSLVAAPAKDLGIPCDMVLDLADMIKEQSDFIKSASVEITKLNSYTVKHKEVTKFNWKDGAAPPVGMKFWNELWEILPDGLIGVCCIGGHGRTGTAVCALMISAGTFNAPDAIAYLRDFYCKKVVETAEQVDYLYSIDPSKPEMPKRQGGNHFQHGWWD